MTVRRCQLFNIYDYVVRAVPGESFQCVGSNKEFLLHLCQIYMEVLRIGHYRIRCIEWRSWFSVNEGSSLELTWIAEGVRMINEMYFRGTETSLLPKKLSKKFSKKEQKAPPSQAMGYEEISWSKETCRIYLYLKSIFLSLACTSLSSLEFAFQWFPELFYSTSLILVLFWLFLRQIIYYCYYH